MPITLEEHNRVMSLMGDINAVCTLIEDLNKLGCQPSGKALNVDEEQTYVDYRKATIESDIEELKEIVAELVREIRKYVEKFQNPFDPDEQDDIPF
jgi:DNA-binding ferritin-like protein